MHNSTTVFDHQPKTKAAKWQMVLNKRLAMAQENTKNIYESAKSLDIMNKLYATMSNFQWKRQH